MMLGNRNLLYTDPRDFYELGGHAVMTLTPEAAAAVCRTAADYELAVVRIEGGFWRSYTFQARRDCIWDGEDPPMSAQDAASNNENAARYIEEKSDIHNAFVLTVASVEGYGIRSWERLQRK